MNVRVEFEDVELESYVGTPVDGLYATCSRCQHSVEVHGTSGASERAACARLRDECPLGERNFYTKEAV